jgi:hypothetical protein
MVDNEKCLSVYNNTRRKMRDGRYTLTSLRWTPSCYITRIATALALDVK